MRFKQKCEHGHHDESATDTQQAGEVANEQTQGQVIHDPDCVRHGTAFPQYLQNEPESVLHTRFNFAPLYRTIVNDNDPQNNISKFENQYVNILKYENGSFRLDE